MDNFIENKVFDLEVKEESESYKKIKEEINKLDSQRKQLSVDRANILLPVYEIINKYKSDLSDVFPADISKIDPNNLIVRCEVLEDDIIRLNVKTVEKENMIEKIGIAIDEIRVKNREQNIIEEKLIELGPKLENRKNYVIEKIENIKELDEKIEKIKTRISELKNYFSDMSLESGIVAAINAEITKQTMVIENYENKRKTILSEDNIEEDINLLSNELNLKTDIEIKTKKEEAKKEVKEEDKRKKRLEQIDKELDEAEKSYWNRVINEESQKEDIDYSFEVFDEQKVQDASEPNEEVLYVNENSNIENSISEKPEEFFNDEHSVEEIKTNKLLEAIVKFKKKIKIRLGISKIASKTTEKIVNEDNEENINTTPYINSLIKSVNSNLNVAKRLIINDQKLPENDENKIPEDLKQSIKTICNELYRNKKRFSGIKYTQNNTYYDNLVQSMNLLNRGLTEKLELAKEYYNNNSRRLGR